MDGTPPVMDGAPPAMGDQSHPDPDVDLPIHGKRSAPWFIAASTVVALWWGYLVIGEFVLSGLPEGLGWTALVGVAVSSHVSVHRRCSAPYAFDPWRKFATHVVRTLALFAALLFVLFLIGSVLPESATTVLAFTAVACTSWGLHLVRLRIYPVLPRLQGFYRTTEVVTITVFTMAAIGAFLARQ